MLVESEVDNRKRQEDEIQALSSIYSCKEFSYCKGNAIECHYNIFPTTKTDFLSLDSILETSNSLEKCRIKYLPPIQIYLELPIDYPTKSAPHFWITNSWLSPWQMSFIYQKLDEIWLRNKGQEVLFSWFEFLRNDFLGCLQIGNTLDVSFMYMVHCCLIDYFKLSFELTYDTRAIYSILFSDPLTYLINYDKYRCNMELESNYYTCIICFDSYSGKKCIKLNNCGHIYCKECIQKYIAIKVDENDVYDITCPDISCSFVLTLNNVKQLCPDLFAKYEHLLLAQSLNSMKDVVFCPRVWCQCPVVRNNETLAICSKCDHTFCAYCYKSYHGAEPCAMTSGEVIKLIQEYKSGNKCQRKLVEKRYGRKQIQIIVEKYLTNEYLEVHMKLPVKYAKACPNCSTMTEKTEGCNKMTCSHCKGCFCWLCGMPISTKNAYEHFLSTSSGCYKRLFEQKEPENLEH